MRVVKMSLVAGLLLGANVYAIDNVKVSGSVQVLYGTQDDSTSTVDMFDKDASYADTAFHLGVTADLAEGVSAGIAATAVSSLGMENNIASIENVWSGAHKVVYDADGNVETIEDALFIDELWVSGTTGKTTGTIGRMQLDTPLAFTEAWGASTNNFEAAVVTNEDLPGTTLLAAWVGKSNGSGDQTSGAAVVGSMTGTDGKFNTFAQSGSYVVGAINNSFEPLTAKAYYYGMPQFADAYWLQADLDMDGIMAGAQYGAIEPKATGAKDSSAYAAMLGYALKDVVTVTAAYSSVDDEGDVALSNVATRGQSAGAQTQLYTEVWWWYGTVAEVGADTYTVAAETTVGDGYDLYLGYWNSENDVSGFELDEVAFTVSKSYGALDTSVALVYDDFGGTSSGDLTTFQVYLTYNF